MANITTYLNNIKNAVFGKDVRGSIHDGIKAMNDEVESTTLSQKVLDSTFNQLIINAGNSNAEVVAARVDESGNSYDNLGKRLNNFDAQFNTVEYKDIKSCFRLNKIFENNNAWTGWKNINIIGDSISYGANTVDTLNDSYVGILRKLFQNEFNTSNYGFQGMHSSMSSSSYKNIHEITEIGTWEKLQSNVNVGRYIYKCNGTGNKLQIKIKNKTKYLKVWFNKVTNGGTFNININGVTKVTQNTNGNTNDLFTGTEIDLSLHSFPLTVEIENVNGELQITGMQYYNDINDVMINNFSRSGALLCDMDNSVIDICSDCNMAIFSLGHNDHFTESNINSFKTKIDRFISKFNSNKTLVVVNDFIWDKKLEENSFKQELKRLANSVDGIYIDYNALYNYSGSSTDINKWISVGFLSDTSHPTTLGHKQIAETIAKLLNFEVTKKGTITKIMSEEEIDTSWHYVNFENGFSNLYGDTDDSLRTRYRKINNNLLEIDLNVKNTANDGSFVTVFTLPTGYRPRYNIMKIIDITGAGKYKRLKIDYYDGFVQVGGDTGYPNFSANIIAGIN